MAGISIIVPTFNEEHSIEELVKRIHTSAMAAKKAYEIIFIDDNSSDATLEKINKLDNCYAVRSYTKNGLRGKAFSLTQGFDLAKYEALCMIDADLQYPPEAIFPMAVRLEKTDIVVANRIENRTSFLRKFLSGGFRIVFGRLLFGLNTDIQSGLKVFKREVWESINYQPKKAWAFDLGFLHGARKAGFGIGNFDIVFTSRLNGESKLSFLITIWEIGSDALITRFGIERKKIGMLNTESTG